ncbi:MAG TPA: hypothetical protein DC017_16395 [Candidatus Wallbacteria bacterium]|nr:hypothetical protein [Candidatus Wallbacteria bacterium]
MSVPLFSACYAGSSVSVEIGPAKQSIRQIVESPNLNNGKASSQNWNENAAPMTLEEPITAPPSSPAVVTDVKSRSPHVFEPALNNPRPAQTQALMNVVLNAQGGDLEINGPGTGIRVAKKDGNVVISPFLTTYNQAKYIVRLFDVSGAEILFNSKPLFFWFRPDDSSNFPAFFKGAADAGSMVRLGPGDFSPKQGLKYNFDIKKDQRIEIETQGNPEPSSFLKIKSDAF